LGFNIVDQTNILAVSDHKEVSSKGIGKEELCILTMELASLSLEREVLVNSLI
jgi:hypothetical protein